MNSCNFMDVWFDFQMNELCVHDHVKVNLMQKCINKIHQICPPPIFTEEYVFNFCNEFSLIVFWQGLHYVHHWLYLLPVLYIMS